MLTLRTLTHTHTRVKRKNWAKTMLGKLIHRIVRDVWPSKCFQLLLLPVLLRCVVIRVRPTRFLDYSQFFNFRLFLRRRCCFSFFLYRELITRSAGSHGNDFLFMTSYRLSWTKKKYMIPLYSSYMLRTSLYLLNEKKKKKITKLRSPIRSRTAATCTSSDSAWKCRNKGK